MRKFQKSSVVCHAWQTVGTQFLGAIFRNWATLAAYPITGVLKVSKFIKDANEAQNTQSHDS